MKKEKAAALPTVDESTYVGSNLPVTKQDFQSLKDQREQLAHFVASSLKKGVDYGVIPGTPKPSLFKPGAEKMCRLFGLGIRMQLVDKEMERSDNFAMFTYKAEIFHLKSSSTIAECEGSCNSQEKKYRERNIYRNQNGRRVSVGTEPTPIFDVLNTLQKMAQKRAFVGAVILAVGASDFFSHDIDDEQDARELDVTPKVEKVSVPGVKGAVSSDMSAPNSGDYVVPFGAFQGKAIREIPIEELEKSIEFFGAEPKGRAKDFVINALNYLKEAQP